MKINPLFYVVLAIIILGGLFFLIKTNIQPQDTRDSASQAPARQETETSDSALDLTKEKEVQMDIKDFAFQKPNIRISVGTKVTWTNRDSVKHTATADDGTFDTGLLGLGESGSYVFNKTGTFGYYCIPHPKMRGSITVVDGNVENEENTFELVIKDRKIISGPSTVRVNQREEITLKITADEAEEFHVHAYDNSIELKPNVQATLTFTAKMSGRFPFELEMSKTELGAIEVQPK